MRDNEEAAAAWIASKILKPQVKDLLSGGISPDQIVFALLTVGYHLYRADMEEQEPSERIELFQRLARYCAREFEKLRKETPPRKPKAKSGKRKR